MLFDNNSQQRKIYYFDTTMIHKGELTPLQCFPKNYFPGDVDRSKCIHATSSNALFCTHYIDDMNYCSLIMVMIRCYGSDPSVLMGPRLWVKVNIMLEFKMLSAEIFNQHARR